MGEETTSSLGLAGFGDGDPNPETVWGWRPERARVWEIQGCEPQPSLGVENRKGWGLGEETECKVQSERFGVEE